MDTGNFNSITLPKHPAHRGNFTKGIRNRVTVLAHVLAHPKCSIADIAAATELKYSTLVKITERMVEFKELEYVQEKVPVADVRTTQHRVINLYTALVETIKGAEVLAEYDANKMAKEKAAKKVIRGRYVHKPGVIKPAESNGQGAVKRRVW